MRHRIPVMVLVAAQAAVLASLLALPAAEAYVQPPDYRRQNSAAEVADPQNPGNDVVRFTTDETLAGIGSVTRDLRAKNLRVADMTNMISVKYFFVGRTCVGGSPRFQLAIDTDGDRIANGNAFGYLGEQDFGGGCPADRWVHQDMANLASTAGNWDLSQFGGPFSATWAEVVAFFAEQTTQVLACGLFDDSGSFAEGARGIAYYDNVQCHDRALEDHQDVRPGTNAPF